MYRAAMDVVIVGGGVAGLEACWASAPWRATASRLTLAAPDPEFSYRPLAVAEPFALGHAYRVPLSQFADDVGAQLVVDATVGVDDAAGTRAPARRRRAVLRRAARRARRARRERRRGRRHLVAGGDPETYGGLLRDIDEGYSKRIAIVVPPGAVWPLPAYELALMTAGRGEGHGPRRRQRHGRHPGAACAVAVRRRGQRGRRPTSSPARACELKTGVVARRDKGGLVLEPGGERVEAQRVYAVPRLRRARRSTACRPTRRGSSSRATTRGSRAASARGQPATRSSRPSSSAASPRIRRAARRRRSRALAGVEDAPDPGEPVIHGRLLAGRRMRRLRGRGDAEGAPLWWPQGKIAGEYLPRWLTEHGVAPPAAEEPRRRGSPCTGRSASCAAPELEYLSGLAREFRSADPAIASLGRHMREARER